jgi:hypothetical protein
LNNAFVYPPGSQAIGWRSQAHALLVRPIGKIT